MGGSGEGSGRPGRVCVAALAAALALALGSAAAASGFNVTGSWKTNYHCEAGWCAGSDFPATTTLEQAEGSSAVKGTNGGETITGTLVGNTLTLHSETGGYTSDGVMTLSESGNCWTGKSHDNNGTSGSDTGERIGAGGCSGGKEPEKEKPGEKTGAHGTGMTVSCDLDALTLQDTCTAVLADTASSNPTGPTGTVTFAAPSGYFPFGKACTLHSSPSAPSTSFCSVAYAPGSGAGFPNVSAGYPGDSTHGAATGSTRFIVPGGEPAGYEESGPGSGYPAELSVEVAAPAAKTEVQVGVDQGETKAPAPPGKHLRALEDPDIIPEMREEVAEREREERYPDIIPEMRKEVEEREVQYEKDIRELRTEINEMERKRAGLNVQATEELTRLLQDDNVLAKQMAEQMASPGLKKDAASQPALAKLGKQSAELQKEIGEVLKIQRQQIEGVIRATKTAFSSPFAAAAAAKKHHGAKRGPTGRLVALGHARLVAGAAGKVKLRVHLNKAQMRRLAHGRKSLKLNMRILMVVPSHALRTGLPLGSLRTITLHAAKRAAGKH